MPSPGGKGSQGLGSEDHSVGLRMGQACMQKGGLLSLQPGNCSLTDTTSFKTSPGFPGSMHAFLTICPKPWLTNPGASEAEWGAE